MKLNIRKLGTSAIAVMIAASLCACSNEKTSEALPDVSADTSTGTTTTASQTTSATKVATESTERTKMTTSKPEEIKEEPKSVYSDEEIENVVDVNVEMIAERELKIVREDKEYHAFTAMSALFTTYGVNFREGELAEGNLYPYNLINGTYGIYPFLDVGYLPQHIVVGEYSLPTWGYATGYSPTNISGTYFDELCRLLDDGNASMIWVTEELVESELEFKYNENSVQIPNYKSPEVVVLVGYSDTGVKVWSPLKEDYVVYDRERFEQRFEELGMMSVMLKKAED